MSLCNSPSQLADTVRIGGVSPLVAQRTGRIVRDVLPDDGRIDREGCRQGYKVRGCLRRGVLPYMGPLIWELEAVDTYQLNPVAKAVFGLASVTFEVRARHWRMRRRGDT